MNFTYNFRKMVAVNHDKGSGIVFFRCCLSIVFNNVFLCQASNMFQSTFQSLTTLESKGGALSGVSAPSHKRGLGSNPSADTICGFSFVVGSLTCSERFFSVYSGSPLFKNQHFRSPIRSQIARTPFPEFLSPKCSKL